MTLACWEGRDDCYLVHGATLEAHKLPPDGWSLVFDGDGFGAVVDSSGAQEPLILEGYLSRKLRRT